MANTKLVNESISKYIMSGISVIISGTLFVYFIYAVVYSRYLIHFSIDAIVGVVALVFLVRNLQAKNNLVLSYKKDNSFLIIDLVSLGLCVLLKLFLKIPFDFSLFILFGTYLLNKWRFEKLIK